MMIGLSGDRAGLIRPICFLKLTGAAEAAPLTHAQASLLPVFQ